MSKDNQYVYGPVPSRRLGRSLGIDLVPFKTCTYDCIYCQLGRTTHLTLERREYHPIEAILIELERALKVGPAPDYIGIAGSGEPTLNSGIGVLITEIKRLTTIPVAVLTNGALLWMPDVRRALSAADVVLPSLDAGDARLFQRINRPAAGIDFDRMVDGLIQFTHGFKGRVWLEILLLAGLNDTPAAVGRISGLVSRIGPERVQLNTACRPAAERYAISLPPEKMRALQGAFPQPVEIICQNLPDAAHDLNRAVSGEAEIMAMLGRRPCTAADVAAGLGIHLNEALKHLERLAAEGKLHVLSGNQASFYACSRPEAPRRGDNG